MTQTPLTLSALRAAYDAGRPPADIVAQVFARIREVADPGIFIHLRDEDAVADEARALGAYDPARPLWGVPFVVKDNIDVAGAPTTAACAAYAYAPEKDAFVIARLRAAGALVIGKANLDQFATGLVGVRSPWPIPKNAIDPAIAPGGSSSGSAVAVAQGIATFSLGTDTAGSGRVPAGLNNIVGLKPSLGALSARGVVPACRTLDTISIFALTVEDAYEAYAVAAGHDPEDPYSRAIPTPALTAPPPALRIGVPSPETIEFCGDEAQRASFGEALTILSGAGAEIAPLDFRPFFDVATMLYEGAWVAERMTVIEDLLATDPEAVHPVTRAVISKADGMTAADAFRGMYRLKALSRKAEELMAGLDMLCVPTFPTFATLEALAADPIGPNSMLGTYTNFVNLMDLCGIAVPTPARVDGRPGSVTLLAPSGADAAIASASAALEAAGERALGATGWAREPRRAGAGAPSGEEIAIAVCGAHMSGLPLNGELTARGGRFLREAETTDAYRLYALPGGPPLRPGLVRGAPGEGAPIALEIWALPRAALGDFIAGIPAPLGIGEVALADGGAAKGFVCEAAGALGARDVTEFGGWRGFIAAPAA